MYESNGCNAEWVEELVNLKNCFIFYFLNIHEDYLILFMTILVLQKLKKLRM